MYFVLCVYSNVIEYVWRLEDNLQEESVLSYYVDTGT